MSLCPQEGRDPRPPETNSPRHGSLEDEDEAEEEGVEEEEEKTALPPTPIPFSSSFISLLP